MAKETEISWCDSTFNGWIGCAKVSDGCKFCYAETMMDTRWGKVQWGKGKPRMRTSAANWRQPVKWNREAGELEALQAGSLHGTHHRPRVFCSSLSDWLDDEVPIEWLADLLALIHATPNLDYLLLSKRLENFVPRLQAVLDFIPTAGIDLHWASVRARVQLMLSGWSSASYVAPELGIENYWIGTTVENQAMADKRIPLLLSIPAKVRFLSCEPMLEAVDLERCGPEDLKDWSALVDWVICGGESGPGARPMDLAWARSLRDQCKAAGTTFFMKQVGGIRKPFAPIPDDLMIRDFPPASAG